MIESESHIRSRPPKPARLTWPAEFPGAAGYGEEEIKAVTRVIRSRSPFRYYGPKCRGLQTG